MRRLILLLVLIVVLLAGALVLAPRMVSKDMIRTKVAQDIAALTGREVSLVGEPEVVFLPEPRITLRDIQISNPEGISGDQLLVTERLTATLRLLPLLFGEVEIKTFRLDEPRIRLVRNAQGRRNWDFKGGTAALALAFAGDIRIGNFEIAGGTLHWSDEITGETESLEKVNLVINWPSIQNPLTLSGDAVWNEEGVKLSIDLEKPFDFARGNGSPARAEIAADPLSVSFQGTAQDFKDLHLSGAFDITTDSVRDFVNWVGGDIEPGQTLGSASIVGQAKYHRREFAVDNAKFELDGNRSSGTLRIALLQKPVIEGTIAFNVLNLDPYVEEFALLPHGGQDGWEALRFDADWFRSMNSDLRLSANVIEIQGLAFKDAAASLLLKDEVMQIGIAESAFYEGSLTGRMTILPDQKTGSLSVQTQAKMTDFDIGEASAKFGRAGRLSGNGTVNLNVAMEGINAGDLVSSLDGSLSLDLTNGSVPGVDLKAVANAVRSGTNVSSQLRADSTDFELLKATILFGDRAALVQKAVIEADGYATVMAGSIGLPIGRVSLSAYMALDGPAAGDIPFEITGYLSDPQLVFSRSN